MLSLQDYRNYRWNRARYTENNFSLLRSKIRELHPVHRASLEALLRHLSLVASHSDHNAMTVEALASHFRYVLRGDNVWLDGVYLKVLVLGDLIRNAHTLFDERPFPLDDVSETTSTFTHGSLFLSLEFPRYAEVIPEARGEARGPKAGETLANSTPVEIVSAERISVAEWRLQVPQSRLTSQPEAVTIPQSPPGSVLSSTSDFPLSSATSLETAMGRFSP